MKNDVFEQCYQFNMERKAFKRELSAAYAETQRKVLRFWYHQWNYDFNEFGDNEYLIKCIKFIFWNNHPYWAWLLHEEFDDPDFLDCAKTVRKIACTYRDLPTHTGLVNYDMYQVAPIYY